ncbi:DinB family protein [Chryseobacterium sp. WG14]|uniref:DinB family protein n=1 Tax=unclassified Chryseobacterium TaxID=2593645 RepID=UPI00211DDC5E|nr:MULTISPECIES: DinB family protein [unclassified Chryseobacterium]MCQ9636330.1 DinB family protein [Chryseobacterium sp. WG23]MCQ9641551.1 DinB family protein [Chryseobacterium sp. WG14]
MKISTSQLLNELKNKTQQHLQYAEMLLRKTEDELNFRISADSWSVLECLEHLNRYGEFYIPEISRKISSSVTSSQLTFKPGILGNYFAKTMLPKEKINKMKTLKAMNPIHSQLNKSVIDEFIRQQKQMFELLEKAGHIDLEKTKTGISISKWISLKLGDTFRFVIYHNERHIIQAGKVLKNI